MPSSIQPIHDPSGCSARSENLTPHTGSDLLTLTRPRHPLPVDHRFFSVVDNWYLCLSLPSSSSSSSSALVLQPSPPLPSLVLVYVPTRVVARLLLRCRLLRRPVTCKRSFSCSSWHSALRWHLCSGRASQVDVVESPRQLLKIQDGPRACWNRYGFLVYYLLTMARGCAVTTV
jgi:hypothetical protein